jgi:hypothetical protein
MDDLRSANSVNGSLKRMATKAREQNETNTRESWTKCEKNMNNMKVSTRAKTVKAPTYTQRKEIESHKLSHTFSDQFFRCFAFIPRSNNSLENDSRSKVLWIEPQLHQLSSDLDQSLPCGDVVSQSLGKTIE